MGERDDLAAALALFHAKSYGWALACCERNADEATDVLQDAYAKVLTGKARFDGRSALKTWFFGVVRLTAREHRRSSVVRFLFPQATHRHAPAPEVPQADEALAERQLASAMSAALAELSDRQREVLHLVFYEDLTIAEASTIMQVSLGTARLHYDRGKKNLHVILERRGVRLP